ncbi:hypothetical protein F4781DRAFT_434934 [Annulohypoxylon bovei var. microspora]|nr:hypothetical protein F4781DRAFT_434934 [Annulohypoxylon bovei var. microspora]
MASQEDVKDLAQVLAPSSLSPAKDTNSPHGTNSEITMASSETTVPSSQAMENEPVRDPETVGDGDYDDDEAGSEDPGDRKYQHGLDYQDCQALLFMGKYETNYRLNQDRHNRTIAQILTRFRNVITAATTPIAENSNAIEHAALNRMIMETETAALISEVQGLLAINRELKALWMRGPLHTPGENNQREAEIDRQAASVARLYDQHEQPARAEETQEQVEDDVAEEYEQAGDGNLAFADDSATADDTASSGDSTAAMGYNTSASESSTIEYSATGYTFAEDYTEGSTTADEYASSESSATLEESASVQVSAAADYSAFVENYATAENSTAPMDHTIVDEYTMIYTILEDSSAAEDSDTAAESVGSEDSAIAKGASPEGKGKGKA